MTGGGSEPQRHNHLAGIGLRLGMTVAFGLMAALIKLASDAGASTPEIIFYRNLIALVPILGWIVWTGTSGAWRTRHPMLHISRGLIGLVAMGFNFSALTYLPLAEAVTLSFVAPLFAVALSAVLLREPVGWHRWSAVALGLAGVIVVMQPAGAALSPLGLSLALLGAIGVAGVTIAIRRMGQTERTETTVLWFTAFSTLMTGLLMPVYGQPHAASTWGLLAAIGLCGGIGQLFLTGALKAAPVSVVVPFDYVQLLWAVTLGWLIWDTHPQPTTWAGAAIIVASGLYTIHREHRLGRDKPRPEPL